MAKQEYLAENYALVNGAWPSGELPKPTGQEAISAVKRLYRLGMGKSYKGKFILTSGRRYTWPRGGSYRVNPDGKHFGGWRDLCHDVSHLIHARRNPEYPGHDFRHAQIERMLIEHVVKLGWLEGKLRRPEKEKPDRVNVRLAQVLAGIERWERKRKRAVTALKKLERQKRYYEKKGE